MASDRAFTFMPYGVSPIRFVLVLPLPVFHFILSIFFLLSLLELSR